MSWKGFLILNLSAVQLRIWPQIYVRKTLYGPAKCSTCTHTKALVCSGGKKARSEICKQSLVGERLQGPHVLCLRGSGAGSAHVAQAVLFGREHSLSRCSFPRWLIMLIPVSGEVLLEAQRSCSRRAYRPGALPAALLQVNHQPPPRGRPVQARGFSSRLLPSCLPSGSGCDQVGASLLALLASLRSAVSLPFWAAWVMEEVS